MKLEAASNIVDKVEHFYLLVGLLFGQFLCEFVELLELLLDLGLTAHTLLQILKMVEAAKGYKLGLVVLGVELSPMCLLVQFVNLEKTDVSELVVNRRGRLPVPLRKLHATCVEGPHYRAIHPF